MDWQATPIFIINHNNLERGFRQQVEWLKAAGQNNINVIDNGSTYAPLLDYYETADINVIYHENVGPYVFWVKGLHTQQDAPYIVSDGDCAPAADCPKDLVRRLHEVYEQKPLCKKAGPGIRIDNLPDTYQFKQQVIEHETQFSLEAHRDGDMFDAILDTTFALYPAGSAFPDWGGHIRLAAPYVIEHYPWYVDSANPTEEDQYYLAHRNSAWTHWR